MANSIKNENSRVASKFLPWVDGSVIMRSTEKGWIPWKKIMNSILDTLKMIQWLTSRRYFFEIWYTLKFLVAASRL